MSLILRPSPGSGGCSSPRYAADAPLTEAASAPAQEHGKHGEQGTDSGRCSWQLVLRMYKLWALGSCRDLSRFVPARRGVPLWFLKHHDGVHRV